MAKNPVTGTLDTTNSTITVTGFSGTFDIAKVAVVTNVKTAQIIFCPSAGIGYTSVASNVITIPFSMTGMSNTDPLYVSYDDTSQSIRNDPAAPSTVGQGGFVAVPAGSTNGTAIGAIPTGSIGVEFHLAGSETVTFTIANSAPVSAPTLTRTFAVSTHGAVVQVNLSGTAQIYVTARSGSPIFRFL